MRDSTPHVVPGEHRPIQPELLDHPNNTPSLPGRTVLSGIGCGTGRGAEAAEVGDYYVETALDQHRGQEAVVGSVAWPAVE